MRLVLSSADLVYAANTVGRIISGKVSGPSSGIRLTAEDNRLSITANDQELGIDCNIAAEVTDCGSIVVPGRLFGEAVRRFPAGDIELHIPEGRQVLSISSISTSIDLLGMSSVNFPELPDIEDYSRFQISGALLKAMMRQVSFALSHDDMRPILTGMLWESKAGSLRMVAADGFKVASRNEEVVAAEEEFRVVLPGRTTNELIRLLDDQEEAAEVALGRNHIMVKFRELTLISRLLEGNYINVDQYLPSKFVTEAVFKPKVLLEALERAAVVAKDGHTGTVRINFKDGVMAVSAQSAEYGSHFEEWPVEITGERLEILFNIKVLSEVLKSVEDGDIHLKFTGSLGPCIGVCAGQSNYWSLAMPVRLS